MKKLIFLAAVIFFSVITIKNSPAQMYNNFTLNDLDGNDVTLSKLLEKGPVMISFWATWCSPCKEEMKKMQPVYEKFKDQGFTYLAVNQDNQKTVSKVKAFINANKYTFPVVLDPEKRVFQDYNGQGIPYSLLIDKNKKIVATHIGYITGDEYKIETEIKDVLNSESKNDNSKGDSR
ncbi:MAG: TlpA family protein disulfide reductase [Ignavibacteria bacterium]|nr:TlpA family protein disulfide reductase [Ignavibacteria bacterium]